MRAVPAHDLLAAIGPATRMVAVSHVLWTTGLVLPLPEIAAAAHAAGATVLIDGAQSGGAIPLDMAATGADFYAVSGQKWLLGPQGTGALWVHPRPARAAAAGDAELLHLCRRPRRAAAGRRGADSMRASMDTTVLAGFAAAMERVEGLRGGRDGLV